MNTTDTRLINKVKQSILSVDKEAEIILFGSRARGEARKDSDWDFLFLTSLQVNDALRHKIIDKIFDIELEEDTAVQVVPKNRIDWETNHFDSPFYRNIEEQGIRL